jgi:hypothetical protein
MSERKSSRLGGWRLAGRTRGGRARGILRLWVVYEWLWLRFHRVYAIPASQGGLFHVQFWRYRGRPIELPDGTRVARGDRVAILHIRNHELAKLPEHSVLWRALRLMSLDLRALAAWAKSPDFPSGVRALFGVTVIGRGSPRLGFTVRERHQSLMAWFERRFLLGILMLYHAHGVARLLEGSVRDTPLVEVWMSLSELERRYGARASKG